MKRDVESVYRIWILLKEHDADRGGSGHIPMSAVKELLTDETSPWYTFSWRRLRQIINEGEGVFWNRDDTFYFMDSHLHLRSAAKVALSLDSGHLTGSPIYIPADEILDGIGLTRANLTTSWESGRSEPSPISRARLQEITGVPVRTQQLYDERLGRQRKRNIAITHIEWTEANCQEMRWQDAQRLGQARPLRPILDDAGVKRIGVEIASTREQVHEHAPTGRKKKHNKKINALVSKQAQEARSDIVRLYYPDAESAASAFNRDTNQDVFWPVTDRVIPNAAKAPRLEGVQVWRDTSGLITGMCA